ncbi:HAMP domain-containing histidine kinase [Ramlibacter sp. AW1]|uniref:histidine kinase n=1 Tax=Ramlibacter aurantiacus TaxID=2801330 RepID=A0A936ZTJ6_9BURK|nr:HAMP domain-containing sensor histidine kinase [Ramlibacter aurantiacus]MBL0423370.1 HAMP domain-containing histidine kinase [Ramlibacter aurantiacus]
MRFEKPRFWSSLGFRVSLYYAVLVAITLLAALAIVQLQTVGVMHQGMTRQLAGVQEQLLARHRDGGLQAVGDEIQRALTDRFQSESEIYLLLDARGQPLAGNLDEVPAGLDAAAGESGELRTGVMRQEQYMSAYLLVRALPGGGTLVVGRDLSEQQAIESLVGNASAAAALVSVLLLIGGTFVIRAELERSIAALRRTAARIGAGELHERVELTGQEDEFELLSHEINQMLDRIQLLMDGVRHVSDTIAHNLRTPLTRVLLRLRAAQDAMPDEGSRQAVEAAVREVEGITVTFEKLLQIAEAEAGTRRRQFRPTDLGAIVDDVLDLYDALAESHGAVLRREPDDPAVVQGDRDLLADAVASLVDNALKYGGDGAVVRVGTTRRGGTVLLTVQDNGPGVPPGEHERIGQRFYRLDRQALGYGLGLAGVRAVVAMHGGRLRFADAAPGLRVEVELPAA